MFGQHQAGPRVREAAKYLSLSQRRFIQVFKAEVGLTPKLFSRIQRFQRIRSFIQRNPSINWADLAVDLGYFDQSHLIREFLEFSGLSPTDYVNRLRKSLYRTQPTLQTQPPSPFSGQVNFIQYGNSSVVG